MIQHTLAPDSTKSLIESGLHYADSLRLATAYADSLHADSLLRVKRFYASELAAFSDLNELIVKIGLLVLYSAVSFFLWRLLKFIRFWLVKKFRSAQGRWNFGFKFRKFELLSADQVSLAFASLVKMIEILLSIVLLYLFLTLSLDLFEQTHEWSSELLRMTIEPMKAIIQKMIKYIPNLISIAVIVFIFRYIIRFFDFVMDNIASGRLVVEGFYNQWADPTRKIIKFILIMFAAILIYPYSPIASSSAAQGISIFVGLMISLGSTSSIGNLTSGILLNYTRAFQIGDRVRIGEVYGDVLQRSWLVLRIRSIHNEEITIPNSTAIAANIINYSEAIRNGDGLILYTTVTIGYDVPWRKVYELLINAALATEGVRKDFKPFVMQLGLEDSYPSYQLNAYINVPGRSQFIYSDLHANIQDQFNAADIEILSPAYQVHRISNETTVPKPNRAEGYTTPPVHLKIQK